MKKIGLIGYGKIGRKLVSEIKEKNLGEIVFIQDTYVTEDSNYPELSFVTEGSDMVYERADLIIECAVAGVLYENIENILKSCDLMLFSVTSFAKDSFREKTLRLAKTYQRKIYIPHGAILGLDGILDGKTLWEEVSIQTIKNPKSLGREDTVRTVVYDGNTKGACLAYPRNVNVHAAVALAGIGFEKTSSLIISDPVMETNRHIISLKGNGTEISIQISSYADSGVTGLYTPVSACGSLFRVLDKTGDVFVV